MPSIGYDVNCVVSRNGGAPTMLSDTLPMVVVDTGLGTARIAALQDDLETAPCDNVNVTGPWTLRAAGSNVVAAASTRTAVRRVTTGHVPFGLTWLP